MNSRRLARTWPYPRYSDYERGLRQAAAAWFKSKGFDVQSRYPFILDKFENWPKNIICSDVVDYIKAQREASKGREAYALHKYIHHGLSSQAMLFNLLGPLIVRSDLESLKPAFDDVGIIWPQGEIKARFELTDRTVFNEDSGQPTSIDLAITGSDVVLFVESKLSEKEFGGCTLFENGDCEGRNPCRIGLQNCSLHHIGRQYWNRLQEHGFLEGDMVESPICPLANYYQFFREVIFALHNKGMFVLLYDERNPAFMRQSKQGGTTLGLWPFLQSFIPDSKRDRIGAVTIQKVVAAISASGRHNDWIDEFRAKYGM